MSRAKLGAIDPNNLAQARLVIHWAAQVVSAAGNGRLPARNDSSHTNLGWSHDLDALVTHPLTHQPGGVDEGDVVAGIVPGSLELFVARGGSAVATGNRCDARRPAATGGRGGHAEVHRPPPPPLWRSRWPAQRCRGGHRAQRSALVGRWLAAAKPSPQANAACVTGGNDRIGHGGSGW